MLFALLYVLKQQIKQKYRIPQENGPLMLSLRGCVFPGIAQ